MIPFAVTPPPGLGGDAALGLADRGQPKPTAPMLGAAAVTATRAGGDLRADMEQPGGQTGGRAAPAPPFPAPVKGLGIAPLNTRQVGDFDRVETGGLPPVGLDLSVRLTGSAGRDGRPHLDLRL